MPPKKIYPIGTPRVIKELSDIQNGQYNKTVTKSNELIRKGCYGLSAIQQKLLCYFIADIKDSDTSETVKEYDLRYIYDFMCINANSREVIQTITAIDKKTWWLADDNETVRYRFFNTLVVTHDNKVRFSFHESVLPYLQNLIANKPYTYYRILYILCMKSEYGIRLYEMLKAAEHRGIWHYKIDYLKQQLDCSDKYSQIGDFKKRVIEPAVADINANTDITVEYVLCKPPRGRSFDGIEFYISTKNTSERLTAEQAIRAELDSAMLKNSEKRTRPQKKKSDGSE